jgi:CDP-paratose 2-epimerase
MHFENILITGGAGFVGSNLAILFREAHPDLSVTVMDSLERRGSELNLPRLREAGVDFRHGDIRCATDFDAMPPFDLLIDCSAEPSVHGGLSGSPRFVLDTNLFGTVNCLEAARARGAAFLFLSTSRVYPIATLNDLPYVETPTRFCWDDVPGIAGFSERGIAEGFALDGPRSFYGASKLACEQLIQEYVYSYGLRAIIDRCGVLAGPWQMGKVDQGVITLWVARHYFARSLSYTGFGGHGKQVRDILHVHDLFDLLELELAAPERWDGRVYNVGGGNDGSVSLRELTALCVEETGNTVPIASVPETSAVDLRIYVTDTRKVELDFGWRPTRPPARIIRDIRIWIEENRRTLESILAPTDTRLGVRR